VLFQHHVVEDDHLVEGTAKGGHGLNRGVAVAFGRGIQEFEDHSLRVPKSVGGHFPLKFDTLE
jgi:hypothetical protein